VAQHSRAAVNPLEFGGLLERRATSATKNGRATIRSSTVHIPVALLPKIAEERGRTGRSNGEIVIVAIESSQHQLSDLIGAAGSTGGTLFERRPSRGTRRSDGPLTALNVRLFQQDYEVLDELVTMHGAFSRGHLIATALTAYFTGQDH
jgi:hypothetical protein